MIIRGRSFKRRWRRLLKEKPWFVRRLLVVGLALELILAVLLVVLVLEVTAEYKRETEADESLVADVSTESSTEADVSETQESSTEEPTESLPETDPTFVVDQPTVSPTVTPTTPPTVAPTVVPTVTPTVPPTVAPTTPPEPATQPAVLPSRETTYPVNENTYIHVPDTATRLFVGDSRFYGMELYTAHDTVHDGWLTGVGEGYYWLRDTGIPAMKELFSRNVPIRKVYLNLGVNDCAYTYREGQRFLAGDYAILYNELAVSYPNVQFYFVSVGPGSGEYYGAVEIPKMNVEVEGFNYYLRINCPGLIYIDSGEEVTRNGFSSLDGIHYDRATYQRMYQYILDHSN